MAQQLLDTLPRARDLASNSTCIICQEFYSTRPGRDPSLESAVLLPCDHHVGAKCISIWLSKSGGNSCPVCRARIFAATSLPSMQHEPMNENEDDFVQRLLPRDVLDYPDLYEASGDLRSLARRVEQAGRPSEERGARSSSVAGDQRRNAGLDYFLHRSTEEYSESLRRARRIELTPVPTPPGFAPFSEAEWERQQRRNGATFDEIADERMYRADARESRITSLARSFRLLPFRECLLYIRLRSDGAQIPRPGNPPRKLNAEQEEALFWEIERRGAFDVVHRPYHGYRRASNRERWRLHRDRHGQVWDPVRKIWI